MQPSSSTAGRATTLTGSLRRGFPARRRRQRLRDRRRAWRRRRAAGRRQRHVPLGTRRRQRRRGGPGRHRHARLRRRHNVNENVDISANGARGALARDVANIVTGPERRRAHPVQGAQRLRPCRRRTTSPAPTSRRSRSISAGAGNPAVGDGTADSVSVDGTNANDQINVALVGAAVAVTGTFGAGDDRSCRRLRHAGRQRLRRRRCHRRRQAAGEPRCSSPSTAAPATTRRSIGGLGNDVLLGGDGNDSRPWRPAATTSPCSAPATTPSAGALATAATSIEGRGRLRHARLSPAPMPPRPFDLVANGGRAQLLARVPASDALDINDVERASS